MAGHTTSTVYNATTHTLTTTTPAGRATVTTLNTDGQTASIQTGNLAPVSYSYDSHGRLTDTSQGSGTATRTSHIAYDPTTGYVTTVTDPAQHVTSYLQRDADGRPKTTQLPDGNTITAAYDATGNVTAITPPSRPTHSYAYTAGDQVQTYTPPTSSPGGATGYTYNLDRQSHVTTLPDGRTITDGYDSAGRLSTVAIAAGTLTTGYDPSSGLLTTLSDPTGATDTYSYDGSLVTALTTSGPVPGAVHYTYDNQHLTALQVGSTPSQTFSYDADDNPTSVNGLTISYDPTNGYPSGTSIGTVTTSTGYNATFGEPATDTTTANGTTAYNATYTRDKLGRITELSETIAGTTTTRDYTYDARGRLTDVTGADTYHYDYDANNNRTTATTPTGTTTASYDNQDRLTSNGNTTYAYNATGQLTTATTGSAVTHYTYDELGRLTSVTKPDGTVISYLYDAQGRRIGKKINGTLVQGFIYGTSDQPLAQTNGAGTIIATYTYTLDNTPDLITTGGVTYRVITDHTGSPRLIINTTTGATVEHLDYDPYGSITTDTNPGFQPFGYTSGLYDPDTGLTHLGARDYNPTLGRFLTKDPLAFNGGDTNIYAYVAGDPINYIDPSGLLFGIHCSLCHTVTNAVVDTVTAPVKTVYHGFQREIYAYEHGCSYLDSIKYGIVGSVEGGVELMLLAAAPEAEPEKIAAEKAVNEGIYVIRGAEGTYVGQSGNIAQRFAQHLIENGGRFTRDELNSAERLAVAGGKTAREIAEQIKIDELGGIGDLLNKVNPIGPRRFNLLPEGYSRA